MATDNTRPVSDPLRAPAHSFYFWGVDVFYSRTARAITIVDGSVAGLRLNLARPLVENN